ncbi:hypothetical protein [Comamonas sp. GB3 AK4-5]|uniref:hypothetical protein n=1 Tax=Comamonas sp. GB3 AK4-5 TaxID=3231487 RepID=UPI00351E9519
MKFRKTNTSFEQAQVDEFVLSLLQAFRDCGYPRFPLYIDIEGYLELEIRMPPSIPEKIVKELGTTEAARAFPAIEIIELEPKLRRRGIFTQLVQGISKMPGIQAVVVSNVFNLGFAQYLEAKCQVPESGWTLYHGYGAPCFAYWSILADGTGSAAIE